MHRSPFLSQHVDELRHMMIIHRMRSSRSRLDSESLHSDFLTENFDEFSEDKCEPFSTQNVIKKYSELIENQIERLNTAVKQDLSTQIPILKQIIALMKKAWQNPCSQHNVAYSLCDVFQRHNGIKLLVSNIDCEQSVISSLSVELLSLCLNEENLKYVIENFLEELMSLASSSNIGLLERLTMPSEGINESFFKFGCSTINELCLNFGFVDRILNSCEDNNTETLQHCAKALANLALYSNIANQKAIVKRQGLEKSLHLAFHNPHRDDYVTYYASMAFTALISNEEIEINTEMDVKANLNMVRKFIQHLDPFEFRKLDFACGRGQSKNWLRSLVPLFHSRYLETRTLATFHFTMIVSNDYCRCNTYRQIFDEIGALEELKKVAGRLSDESDFGDVAFKLAGQALIALREEPPEEFRRYMRSINNSNDHKDSSSSSALTAGNSKVNVSNPSEKAEEPVLDVFISYRRNNGSHLASLLEDHLKNQFQVFLDVSGLGPGHFDKNLLNNIKRAKNFVLVLTPNALDRCFNDDDWLRMEIVAALEWGCNIIPVTHNFVWPEREQLPEDIRAIYTLNAVNWSHEYQKASLKKLEKFITKTNQII